MLVRNRLGCSREGFSICERVLQSHTVGVGMSAALKMSVCLLHFVGITTGDASLPALLLPVKL